MSRHTPGPWRVVTKEEGKKAEGWPLFSIGGQAIFSGPMHGDSLGAEEYDAAVAAAAPEMLDALEEVIEEFDPKECNCDGATDAPYACYFHRIERKVRAAIAKAGA